MFILGQNYDIMVNSDNISGLHIEKAVYKSKEVAEFIFKGLFNFLKDSEDISTVLPTDDEAIEMFEKVKKEAE